MLTQDLANIAEEEGIVSPNTARSMTALGGFLQNALIKTPASSVADTEVVIYGLLLDDSGSMAGTITDPQTGKSEALWELVIPLNNIAVTELQSMKLADKVLILTEILNSGNINTYTDLNNTELLSALNYGASGGTPLYQRTFEFFSSLILKATEFINAGKNVRIIAYVISDGEPTDGSSKSVKQTYDLITDLTAVGKEHTIPVVAVAIGLGTANFRSIFRGMGFLDANIRDGILTRDDIKKLAQTESASIVKASTSAAGFASLGGFTP